MKKYRKVIALLLALATVSDTVPVITNPITVEAASTIKLSKTKLTMGLGDSYTLKLTGAKNPVWKSSNSKIAIVKNGKVIARKSGKVTISATYKGKSYKCIVLVKAPKISSAKFSMTVGTKKQVKVLNTINRVAWFTSNKSIAVVDRNGLVTARKAGTVKIVGKLHGKRYTSVITVKKSLAKPVTLSKKSAKVLVGSSLQLKLNNAVSSKVVWKTSNKAIATVSKGKVIPKKSGKVTITAVYNKKSYKCTIVVPQPAIISSDGYALAVGKSLTLKTTNTKGTVTWKSSDTSVATINSLGKVTAKKAGKTTISAVVGGYTIKKNIEVVAESSYVEKKVKLVPGETYTLPKGTVLSYTNGLVSIDGRTAKMLKPGTANVTVKGEDGFVHDYEFTIKKSSITATEMELEVGFSDVLDLLDNELPITWSSSNPAIVTVDKNGIIVGKKKGTAIITGLAGGVKYTCKVTVVADSSNGNGSNNGNGNNTGNNGNGSNGSNTGNNGGSNTGNNGNNGNGSTGSNTGNNGNGSNNGSTGGSTGGNTTVNKPSTVTPDSEAEVKRYDWNEIKNTEYNQLGKLIHNSKMQIIIDNAPSAVKFEVVDEIGRPSSSRIAINKNGVITTKADTTKAGDQGLEGYSLVRAICGEDYADFMVNVQALSFTIPDKKIYEFGYTTNDAGRVYTNAWDIPQEARSDVFDYFFANNSRVAKAKYEVLYGQKSEYLDFGSYAVKGWTQRNDSSVWESSARMDAVFGWLKSKPDYIKVREVARWMNSHIIYGDYTSDGTFLGMKTGICGNTAYFFSVVMWYLGVNCDSIVSHELNHAWNTVQIDGYWYSVDVTAPRGGKDYVYDATYSAVFRMYDNPDVFVEWLKNQGYFKTHPYGAQYLTGCKAILYNTLDELKADLDNKSSKLWQQYDADGVFTVNVPSSLEQDGWNLIKGYMPSRCIGGSKAYQNPLTNVADGSDKSRITMGLRTERVYDLNTTPLPSLSNYLN